MRRVDLDPLRFASVLYVAPVSAADALAALVLGSPCVVFDLEKADPATVSSVAKALAERPADGPLAFARLAPLDDGGAKTLETICPSSPDAIVATRAETGADLQHLGALLAVEEAKTGLREGAIGIVAVAETTAALFGLIGFSAATPRLVAIGWNGEALGNDFGVDDPRETDGRWSDPLQTARTLTLAAAADARLPAIDSRFSTRDRDAFRQEAERARRDGFAGKTSLDEGQAAVARSMFGDSRRPR